MIRIRFQYYSVDFSDRGLRGEIGAHRSLPLALLPMTRRDEGTGIGWNPAVERFQAIEPNGVFAPEVKNPKNIGTSK